MTGDGAGGETFVIGDGLGGENFEGGPGAEDVAGTGSGAA